MKVTPGFNYDLKISNAFIYKHISSTSSGIVFRSVHCDSGIDPLYILLICLAAIVIVIFFFVGYFRFKKNRTTTDIHETAMDENTPELNRKDQIDILYQKL